MRFSLFFVSVAMAGVSTAAGYASKEPRSTEGSTGSTTTKNYRELARARMVRRSPRPTEQTTQKLKSQVDVKCYGPVCSQGSQISSFYTKEFAVYAQFTEVQSFSGCGCFPNFLDIGKGFSQVTSAQSATAGFAVLSNTLMAYGAYIKAQTSISIQAVVVSFQNLCQTLSVFFVQIQSIGSIGGSVITYYTQTILAIQGFLTRCFTEFSQQVFIQAIGGQWSTFTSLFIQIIQFGQSCGLLSDPSVYVQQGINLLFFEQQCQIPVSSVCDLSVFVTQVTSCATFCSGSSQFAPSLGGLTHVRRHMSGNVGGVELASLEKTLGKGFPL